MSEYKNPVCRGCWLLGTACGRCERCVETRPKDNNHDSLSHHFENLTRMISPQERLTKRELFAAMAMQGMLSNGPGIDRVWKGARENNPHLSAEDTTPICSAFIAERAVEMADCILKELEK